MPVWEDASTGQKLEMLREDFRRLADAVDRLVWTAGEEAKLLQATVAALEGRLQQAEAGSKSGPAGG
jgi:BMFP domain-containing protein YqiC